jgi:hypothetical protein
MDLLAINERDIRRKAESKPDPAAYLADLRACVTLERRTSLGDVAWVLDRDSDCYRELWRRERGTSYPIPPKPARPTETHAKTRDGFRFGMGDALAWAFGVAGYKVNAGCACKATQRWMNERRWHEWTQPSVRAELLKRLSDEARRRKILPGCSCGKCADSWARLVYHGIRDRLTAAWRAIHAHGTRNHRGNLPRAGRLLPENEKAK